MDHGCGSLWAQLTSRCRGRGGAVLQRLAAAEGRGRCRGGHGGLYGQSGACHRAPCREARNVHTVGEIRSHHLEAMGNHLFVGIDRGLIILGLLRWCRISSTHSRTCQTLTQRTRKTLRRSSPVACLLDEVRVKKLMISEIGAELEKQLVRTSRALTNPVPCPGGGNFDQVLWYFNVFQFCNRPCGLVVPSEVGTPGRYIYPVCWGMGVSLSAEFQGCTLSRTKTQLCQLIWMQGVAQVWHLFPFTILGPFWGFHFLSHSHTVVGS